MEELIVLLISLLVKAFDKGGAASRPEQARRQWEQQQAWEQQHRQWLAQRQQWDREQAAQAAQPSQAQQPARKVGRKQKRRAMPVAPPPVPGETFAGALGTSLTEVAAPAPRPVAAGAAAAGAADMARWMRPETLRSRFILTEILKPPVALRRPRV